MSDQEQQVTQVLKSLQPAMEADGGGVDLVSVEDGIVSVKFKGACLICPSINMTIKLGLLKTLQEQLPWVENVVRIV